MEENGRVHILATAFTRTQKQTFYTLKITNVQSVKYFIVLSKIMHGELILDSIKRTSPWWWKIHTKFKKIVFEKHCTVYLPWPLLLTLNFHWPLNPTMKLTFTSSKIYPVASLMCWKMIVLYNCCIWQRSEL